jgi:hypothetical protein
MKKSIIVLALLASACSTTDTGLAPQVRIPPIPENLSQRAGQLPSSSDTTMGGQVLDNTRNIRTYNEKAFQVNDLIDLYNCVREAINNKKEVKCQ